MLKLIFQELIEDWLFKESILSGPFESITPDYSRKLIFKMFRLLDYEANLKGSLLKLILYK